MNAVKKIIIRYYQKLLSVFNGISCYINDLKYFMKESNLDSKDDKEAFLRSTMIANYHIIEKGLSMPHRRLGFGKDVLISLTKICKHYFEQYGNNDQLEYAVSIVKEYDELHKAEKYKLDDNLQDNINSLLLMFPNAIPAEQIHYTKKQFFDDSNAPFDVFSCSRHSMRHFGGKVDIEQIKKAVNLAKNAPSACNKQPVRIYVVSDKQMVSNILEMQQGNRGFGQDIDKVIIITTQYTGCTRFSERYMPFMDAGIFTMNLLYSLHFYHIGAIPLVWLSTKERDNKLRDKVNIPQNEVPAIVIGLGDVTDTIICAQSPRIDLDSIMKY